MRGTAPETNNTGSSQSVTEDGAGNELTVGSSSYTYSSRNHLASGDGVSYVYDGLGRRVSATVSGTGTRVSLYDPNMHLQAESSLSSGSIAYDYIWFGDIPVAQEDIGGNTHWTVTDYRGEPYMQTDSSAAVYWQADYAPFGAVYALRTSDAHQPLRLPGQEAEEFTAGNANGYSGRFYNGYRWYRPLIGRYTQADPLDYGGGLMSLYTYAANNPINFIDTLGLGYNFVPAMTALGTALGITAGASGSVAADLGTAGVAFPATPFEIGGAGVAGGALGAAAGSGINQSEDAIAAAGSALANMIGTAEANAGAWLSQAGGRRNPPNDAENPNGAKAPGKPTADDGYVPADGKLWGQSPNSDDWGWVDENGDVWVPTGPTTDSPGNPHGGPHWDVQSQGGGYRNVRPNCGN